jgi:hypothetical protein
MTQGRLCKVAALVVVEFQVKQRTRQYPGYSQYLYRFESIRTRGDYSPDGATSPKSTRASARGP